MAFRVKTAYGLVALLELAALHADGGILRAGEIARRQGIPERYLEQMLTRLRRGGLLRSLRGPHGGYRLARPPEAIRISEVVHCLEGGDGAGRAADPATAEFAVVAGLEAALARCRDELLAGRTLAELLKEREQIGEAPLMYFI